LRTQLAEIGIPSNSLGYPPLVTDGVLRSIKPGLIQIGDSDIDEIYCIDVRSGVKIVFYNKSNHDKISVINNSYEQYIQCQYTLYYFCAEIEGENIHGNYWEGKNNKKYAQILREMFQKYEPEVEKLATWFNQYHEREIGAL
jgi:hypothetical protein